MSDDIKTDFSADIEAARKKRVEAFKLNINTAAENTDAVPPTADSIGTEESTGADESNADSRSESTKGTDKYNFEIDNDNNNDNNNADDESGIDTDAPSKMMADDFSDKYSLHKYTDADQVPEDDALADEDMFGIEDIEAKDASEEISSFSNAEQKHKMYKEEKKALKSYRKSEKARQKAKAEKNGCMFRLIWLCMVVAISVVLGMYIWNGMSDLLGINRPEDGENVVLDLDKDVTFDDVVDMLVKNDLIKNEPFFRFFATITNKTTGFEEGIYNMRPNMDYEAILSALRSGQALTDTVTVQFKEGMTVMQVAEALEDKKVCKADKFLSYCNSHDFDDEFEFLKDIPENNKCVYRLEGYLFPDTYEFYIGEDAKDSVRRFLNNFQQKICVDTQNVSGYTDAVTLKTIIEDKGKTINDVVKMASLIQAEAADTKDMYVVSSVFYNRLSTIDSGGVSPFGDLDLDKLKSDATLYYPYSAQDDIPSEIAATFKSNYNTYDISGLPPGAICNPGLDAIDAAINPDDTNYYYFCHRSATTTQEAKAYYASTFAEHQSNMAEAGLS